MLHPGHTEIQEQIRNAPNAFVAKQVAYEHIDKTRADWKDVNVQAMAYVVTRKRQSPGFVAAMAATGGKPIVDISTRDAFWGAKPNGQQLTGRSEEHTSELQSLMRTSYAVFCWKKKHNIQHQAHLTIPKSLLHTNKHIQQH